MTNDAIEFQLEDLRKRQDELVKDIRELRAADRSLYDKIDAVYMALKLQIGLEQSRTR